MSKYIPPSYNSKAFHCVYCGVLAVQYWQPLLRRVNSNSVQDTEVEQCSCMHCREKSFWYNERMIVPLASVVPGHHVDLPENCRNDYDEARDVVGRSPKAAAALMRLVLQKLMTDLGEPGKNINDDIKSLVGKGLPPLIQQALDYCRVVGNNAVHPGEIDLNDTPEIAHSLFEMVNFIVEDRIAKPKQVQALYDLLPKGARDAIAKRDGAEK